MPYAFETCLSVLVRAACCCLSSDGAAGTRSRARSPFGRYNNVTGQTSYQQSYGAGAGVAATTGYSAGAMVPQQSAVAMQPVYQQPVPVSDTAA